MNENPEKNNPELEEDSPEIIGSVIQAINDGQVKVSPKWQMLLRSGSLAVICLLLAVLIFYVESFIFFSLKHTGMVYLPAFGPHGWLALLIYMPWELIAVTLLLIVLLELLLRRYSMTYHRPLIYSFILVFIAAGVVGWILAPYHQSVYRVARDKNIPLLGDFYRNLDQREYDSIRHGVVVNFSGDSYIIQRWDGATTSIIVGRDIELTSPNRFQPGDELFFFGDEGSGQFQARGMRLIMHQFSSQ